MTVILAEYQQNFNSQPHKEADAFLLPEIEGCDYFNSQPHKEADKMIRVAEMEVSYFNSQPHKEADALVGDQHQWEEFISTHSLTRRLTGMLSLISVH